MSSLPNYAVRCDYYSIDKPDDDYCSKKSLTSGYDAYNLFNYLFNSTKSDGLIKASYMSNLYIVL